jgi:hypothetical protein
MSITTLLAAFRSSSGKSNMHAKSQYHWEVKVLTDLGGRGTLQLTKLASQFRGATLPPGL